MNSSVAANRLEWYRRVRYKIQSVPRNLGYWLSQKAIDLVVWLNRGSNYISHTKREVPEWFKEEGPNRWMADCTVELLAVLSHQGHSGGSIGFAVQFFSAMARFKPWGPLTGVESEWGETYDHGTQQNIRCSHVFRDPDGRAYDSQGKVFRDPDGSCYTNRDSKVFIEFPYTPKVEYVDMARS
jgi:hypothetical protein